MISKEAGRESFARSPGPVSEPEKEAPLTDDIVTFHGDSFPGDCCEHCTSRRQESITLRARANLLREAVNDREPWGVVAHHAVELVEMMRARGMA